MAAFRQYTFLCFICLVVRLNTSFRLASSCSNRSALFTAVHSSLQPTTTTKPDQTIFGDVSVNLETSTYVPGPFSGMERVALAANGNLQRILSAYYGAPINVKIKRCVEIGNTTFDREVDLLVHGKVVCTAVGQISIYSEECLRAIRDQKVGVGQLFRHFKTTPSFKLLRAGRRLVGLHDVDDRRGGYSYSIDDGREGVSSVSSVYRDASRVSDSVLQVHTSDTLSATLPAKPPGNSAAGDSDSVAAADKDDYYSIWREYELYNQHMHCRFVERFTPGFLNIGSKK